MPTSLLSCLILIAAASPPDCRLEDRHRFPPQPCAVANLSTARAHRYYLEQNPPLSSYRWEDWREAQRVAKWHYDCWDWLNAAQGGEGRGPDYWLFSLRRLRELIGEEAYAAGWMPPPIPGP